MLSYLFRCFRCCVCRCCEYTDGDFKMHKACAGVETAAYERARDLEPPSKRDWVLFQGEVEPRDVVQGTVGNCWLMSAFACLACHSGAVRNIFVNKESSSRGKYELRLWKASPHSGRPVKVHVIIDDAIPVDSGGKPVFARPHGNELWVMLLEKAVAKLMGGYKKLDGGTSAFAFAMLTGDPCFFLVKQEGMGTWKRSDLDLTDASGLTSFVLRDREEVYTTKKTFDILREYNREGAIMAASAHSTESSPVGEELRGIVQNHAYAILDLRRLDDHRLIRLRNPWGSGEWTGAWGGVQAAEWAKYPNIKDELKPTGQSDGTFWMNFADFHKVFDRIDICDRSVGEKELALEINEELGCCGPCCACCSGCCGFWCCKGCGVLFCSRKADGATRKGEKPCCGCCGDGR
eukprot:TRINITY_DN9701_c0_g1_i2.p1 TRINITY_DN9701_c0_g1~~TRINITY_DN9701_c0_g1_i2.p1  ORF type:complete len:405 (+),score=112.07 TRINITY_DN9701_c0_g1_i2:1250-2464(+)